MADQAVENARRHRDQLAAAINKAQSEIDEWRRQLNRVDGFLSDYEAFAADVVPDLIYGEISHVRKVSSSTDRELPLPVVDGQKRLRTMGNSSKEEVAKVARHLIEDAGRPLPREELYEALVETGLTIAGADVLGVMNTMLWRTRDEFGVILLRNVGYWIKEKDWLPGGYISELDDMLGVEEASVDDGTSFD